jgi:hypothetical protein
MFGLIFFFKGFVTSIDNTIDCYILSFINDIDLLMVEKICQNKMEEARQQIKTDLHQLIAQQNMVNISGMKQ